MTPIFFRWAMVWLATAVVVARAPRAVAQDIQGEIHFHTNYNDALREAKLTQKPIFLEFRCAP